MKECDFYEIFSLLADYKYSYYNDFKLSKLDLHVF